MTKRFQKIISVHVNLCRRIAKSNNIIGSYYITDKNGAGGVSVQKKYRKLYL